MPTREVVRHHHRETEMHSSVFRPQSDPSQLRPAVVVMHAWGGCGALELSKAEALAEQGYVGVAADLYGNGKTGNNKDENAALMQPFLDDRAMLRDRLLNIIHFVRGLEGVDPERIAAIGFCFGGLCVLDMIRANAPVQGVVSFHGLLNNGDLPADGASKSRALVLHGYDDPMAKPDALIAFADEFTKLNIDWQIHAFGGTMHAFTNPQANDPDFGTVFSASANRRSWELANSFLEECLQAE